MISKHGKAEIAKTLEIGPKPIEGDVVKLGKEKRFHQRLREII